MNGTDGRNLLRKAEQAFGDMDSQLIAKDAEILNLKRDILTGYRLNQRKAEAEYLKLGVSYSAMHQRAEVAEDKLEKAEAENAKLREALEKNIFSYNVIAQQAIKGEKK